MTLKNPNKSKSIYLIIYLFLIAIAIGIIRLYYLQILCKNLLSLRSEHNFVRLEKIPQPRGNIVDMDGNILATNKSTMHLYWQGTGKKQLTDHQKELLHQLEIITDQSFSPEFMQAIIRTEQYEKQYKIAANLKFQKLSFIAEQFGHEPNILIKSSFKRYYPYHSLASHVIGYLSYQDEPNGKMGLEKLYHESLKGEPDLKKCIVNATGKFLKEEALKTGNAGQTVSTTLRLVLQQYAEELFPQDLAGCLIVMDPATGALRTLISRPSFDPGMFLKPISCDQWTELQERRPFLNRICEACYPPASLFKLIVAAAALEERIVTQKTRCYCRGYINYCGRKYHCRRHEGHGDLSFKKAVAQSCNIIFFEIGKRISIDKLADYAHRFGLGKPTGINFPEKVGLIPTSRWKLLTKGEHWWQGDTVSVAIGQSYTTVTPLQIARMQSAIFTGFLIKPRLLENDPIEKEPLIISQETLNFLKKSMKAAVQSGTGQRVKGINDLTIYAKTGTAQVSSLEQQRLNPDKLKEHAWFICTFIYKNEKPLVIVTFVEHAGGSWLPTSIAKKFLVKYRNYMRSNETAGATIAHDPLSDNHHST